MWGLKPVEKFLFAVVLLFILGLAFQFLGAVLAAWIYGFGVKEILMLEAFDDPKYVAASKLIQIIGSLGTFIIPAFLFSYLFSGDLFSYYGFSDPAGAVAILLTVVMMVSVIPLINYLAEINMRMEFPVKVIDRLLRNLEGEAEKIMRAFTATSTFWGFTGKPVDDRCSCSSGGGADLQGTAAAAYDRYGEECPSWPLSLPQFFSVLSTSSSFHSFRGLCWG